MSHATYHSQAFRPQTSPIVEFLRELFAATPLGIFIAAIRSARQSKR